MRRTDSETEALVLKMYETAGGNTIARTLGIGMSTVHRILKRHGVELRTTGAAQFRQRKLSDEDERRISEQYAAGVLSSDLSEEYGVHPTTIRQVIRRVGGEVFVRGNRARNFSDEDVAMMGRLWKSGESQAAIGRLVGCSQALVYRVLRQSGIEPKPRHNTGPRHGSWRGGSALTTEGYVLRRVERDDPMFVMNRGGYVPEHRLVMARHLGRPLKRHETVHHVNGDRTDNRLDNLQLRQGKHGAGVVMVCRACGSHDVGPDPLD